MIQYQGRVQKQGVPFAGVGQFKFALVNADASRTYWSNAPDADSNGEPDRSVEVAVTRGLCSVLLGDSSLPNMQPLPGAVFTNSPVYLRVWFGDGQHPAERLLPDQRIVSVGYALIAAAVAPGSVTLEQLAPETLGAVQSGQAAARDVASLTLRADLLQSQVNSLSNQVHGLTAVSVASADASLLGQGFVPFFTTPVSPWIDVASSGALLPRFGHSAVWTGAAWIVWGGNLGGGGVSGSGAAYDPASGNWEQLPSSGAPAPRSGHSAVWTGTHMLVWGGFSSGLFLQSGAKYSPSSHQWNPISLVGAPAPRSGQVAAWTGTHLVVWGGRNAGGILGDGALYDPASDQWSPLPDTGAPAGRYGAAAVWAGDRLVVWGGLGAAGVLNSGAQLRFLGSNPPAWGPVSSSGAPSGRSGHSLVWTGQKAIVWGGERDGSYLGDGAAYDPVADSWRLLPTPGDFPGRANHSAVWSGTEMVVLAGQSAGGALGTGGAYSPAGDQWRRLGNGGALQARSGATADWTGTEILIVGGVSGGGAPLSALQRLNPQPAWTFYRKP